MRSVRTNRANEDARSEASFSRGVRILVCLQRAFAMSKHVKALVEKTLGRTGVASAFRAARRRDILVLAYHNIVPHGEPIVGDRSLHLEQYKFARQLDWLRRTYDIVPLTKIFHQQRKHRRPRAAITFDDAYHGAVTAGVKEVVERDLPATIFVAPAFIGGSPFWWDLLLAAECNGSLTTDVRQYCVDALDGQHDRVLAWAKKCHIEIGSVPAHQTAATEEELATCMRSGRITFGSHTWSHPNLSRLRSSGDLEAELSRPLEWLQSRFEHVVPWLAYPYGIGSNEAAAAAQRMGYDGALLVSGGLIMRTDLDRRRFMMPRLNVPSGLSIEGLALRGSGLLP